MAEFEDFESGTLGESITTGNTAYDSVDGTGTAVFDDTFVHDGSLSGKLDSDGSNQIYFRHLNLDHAQHYRRFYLASSDFTATFQGLVKVFLVNGDVCNIFVRDDNEVRVTTPSGRSDTSPVLVYGEIFRLEFGLDGSSFTVEVYTGADVEGTTPTASASVAMPASNVDAVHLGERDVNSAWTLHLDDDAYSTSGWVGPKSTAVSGSGSTTSTSAASGTATTGRTAAGSASAVSTASGTSATTRSTAGSTLSRSESVGHVSTARFGSGATTSGSDAVGTGVGLQQAAAGILRPTVGLSVRLFDDAGNVGEFAPDWTQVRFLEEYNGAGTISVDYAKTGINKDLIVADRAEGALFDGAQEIPETRFLVTQTALDAVKADDTTVSINMPQWVPQQLTEAKTYPPSWPTAQPSKHKFGSATPGEVMGTLIQEAQTRGAIPDVSTDFDASVDSNGAAWDQVVTFEVSAGRSARKVLADLVKMGVADWVSEGRTLRMFNPGGNTVDRTAQADPMVLFAGRDVLDAPEKRDVGRLRDYVLVEGEDGHFVEEGADGPNGRRIEGFLSESGVSDEGTLRVIAQAHLAKAGNPQLQLTHTLALMDPAGPQPWVDFNIGDQTYRDMAGDRSKVRIVAMSATYDQDGMLDGAVTLGDRFDAIDAIQNERIDNLAGGSEGSSAPAPDQPDDDIAPLAPDGLIVDSSAYVSGQGSTFAAVAATWSEVTEDTDGSPATDLDHYEVQWAETNTGNWEVAGQTRETSLNWSPMPPGTTIDVRVRAVDYNGNASAWSAVVSHTTAADTVPPPTPTDATVTPYLGQLKVGWDGQGLDGSGNTVPMPADFKLTQVHASTAAGFTASASTRVDNLSDAGTSVLTDLAYGTTYFVKLIAEDHSGNTSDPSAEVSGTPQQVVNVDVGPDAIDSAQIVDLAVVRAKIDDLAVNDAKIANMSAGKITAGTVNADVVVGQRFTTALTGQRVQLGSDGLKQYDSGGNLTVSITPTGDALFVGELRSALTGQRIVYNASAAQPEILFHSDASTDDSAAAIFVGASDVSTGSPSLGLIGPDPDGDDIVAGLTLDDERTTISRYNVATGSGTREYIQLRSQEVYAEHGTQLAIFAAMRLHGSSGTGDSQAYLIRENASNGDFGGVVFFHDGTATIRCDPSVDIISFDGTAWRDVNARAFNTQSSRSNKTDVRDLPSSALAGMRAAPVTQWHYIGDDAGDPYWVGPMLDDLPTWMSWPTPDHSDPDDPKAPAPPPEGSRTYSVPSMVGFLMAAVRELDIELDELRRGNTAPIPDRTTRGETSA